MNPDFTVIDTGHPGEWESWTAENVTVTTDGVELARSTIPTYVDPRIVGGDVLASVDAVDVDVARNGDRYVLTDDGALYRASDDEPFERVACDDLTARGRSPTGFCLSGDSLYVVGRRSQTTSRQSAVDDAAADDGVRWTTGYVQSLSRHSRQTRWTLDTTDELSFADPVRVVRGPSTRAVYVLDRGGDEEAGFVARVTAEGEASRAVRGLRGPIDFAVTDDDGIAVLDVGDHESVVFRWYPPAEDTGDGRGRSRPVREENDGGATELPVEGAACLETLGEGAFLVGVGSDVPGEKSLYRYDRSDDAAERLTSFKRSCVRLRRTSHAASRLYAIDAAGTLWTLEPATTVSRWRGEHAGRLTTRYDFGSLGAEWYRVAVELGEAVPGTRVGLRYATTNRDVAPREVDTEETVEADGPSEEESSNGPIPVCRDEPESNAEDDDAPPVWQSTETANPNHVLVRARGRRYLWLRLELTGDQYATPTVERLKLSVSHRSFLDSLPAMYRADEDSADFLGRFLAAVEDTYADFDHAIRTLTAFFDPETVPAAHVSWLGSWLSVAEDDAWSEQSKRRLVDEAPTLFKRRGTRRGLLDLLDIYLDGVPVRPVRRRAVDTDSEGGPEDGHFVSLFEYWDLVSDGNGRDDREGSLAPFRDLLCCPQEFLVLLGPTVDSDATETVRRVVESEKPAHTVGRTVSLRPWGRLGGHVYLGINSRLPSREFVVDESNLGSDSVVESREPSGELGWRSSLDDDLNLS